MSRENVEVVRRSFEAWQRDDLDAWLGCHDPAIEWHAAISLVEGVYRGADGTREFWTVCRSEIEDLQIDLRELREVDEDRVLLLGHIRWRGPASGIEVDAPLAQLVTVCHGKIVRSVDYLSHQDALEAVGLRD